VLRYTIPFLLATLPVVGRAQTPAFPPVSRPEDAGFSAARLARMDTMVNGLIADSALPGVVVLIIRNGRTVLYKAYGVRNTATRDPLKRDDIFRLASQSKAITALAVMMLWEEGRFQLDDPIARYIPEFTNPTVLKTFHPVDSSYTTEPADRPITIRQLQTHTGGLDYAAIGSDEFQAIYAKAGVPSGIGNDRDRLGDKMKILARLPLHAQPGEQFIYSLSSDVLGYFVEVISGMSFDRFLRTRIFEPLGMKDTWFYLPRDRADRLVTLHDGESGKVRPMAENAFDDVDPDYPKLEGTYFSGGAGLSGSIEDYAKFLQLFLNGGEYNGVRLLSPKTVAMMLTDQLPQLPTEFGLGFGLETAANDYQSPQSIGSFTWGGAFNTTYWADPKEQLIALCYTNTYRTPRAGQELRGRFTTLTYAAMVK
jgi:CubicO group peptidase (beta-lactamase class C family)